MSDVEICSMEDCGRIIKCRKLCDMHYHRLRVHGSPYTNFKPVESHGMSKSPEYWAWRSMLLRCNNPKNHNYKNYGGRGIVVCGAWQKSFTEFYKHVGKKPTSNLTLDRIDNDGNYEPGNVRWATRQQQNNNRRKPHKVDIST